MKTRLLILTSIIAVALAVVAVRQQQRLRSLTLQLAQTEAELSSEAEARLDEQNKAKTLERGQSALNQQVFELSTVVANLRTQTNSGLGKGSASPVIAVPASGDADSNEGGFFGGKAMGDALARMMKNPAMKEMMRSQQKLMINSSYGPLFKDLALNDERKAQLTQLLLDQQMQALDKAQSALGTNGGFDFGKLATAAKDQESQNDDAIKSFLGDQYPYYEDYKKTMGDRVQLEQLRSQLDGTKSALNDSQIKDILYVIADEREKQPPLISQDPQAAAANLEKMFSTDTMDKQLQWQEEINKRVLDRAAGILSPEQLKSYSEFQSQQLDMQKLGMKMAREMFGTKPATPR